MNSQFFNHYTTNVVAISQWRAMLVDQPALLAQPGAHHKALLTWANALHRQKLIDGDELGEMLELADGALAFAIEAMLDVAGDE